jgi:hypothetical protein
VQLGHTLQQHALALAPPPASAKQHANQQDPGNSQAQQVRTHMMQGCLCCCSSCALGVCFSIGARHTSQVRSMMLDACSIR